MKRNIPRLEGEAKKVGQGELIGIRCRIAKANDAGIVGLEGDIIDETLHTVTLRIGDAGGRRVQLAKSGATFSFDTGSGWVDVPGAAIQFRSQDRAKKVK